MKHKKINLLFFRVAIILFAVGLVVGIGSFAQADALPVDFRQVANNDDTKGYATGEVHWIGSIVQASNSIYYEGMDVGQRVVFTSVPVGTGTHTLTLKHQFTKGGIHAYDWITSYEQMVIDADALGVPFVNVSGGTLTDAEACGDEIGPPGTLGATALAIRQAGNYIDVTVPDDSYVSKNGDTALKIANYEAAMGHGDRTVRIYAPIGATISGGLMTVSHDVANGADTGDSYALYELTWTSNADQFLIEMAGHLAVGGDGTGYTWGEGLGSSSISGGPYHFKLDYLDTTSLGSQDNQIKGADILLVPATPTIITTPNPTEATVGDTLNDSATLSGGDNPTGSIVFNLYGPDDTSCEGAVIYTETVAVSGNGVYSTSGGYTTTAAGTYSWTAAYSGDGNNDPATSGCGLEEVVVEPGICWGDETAWAYGGTYAEPSWDHADSNNWGNWGWTNGLLSEGSYVVWDLYAGAGQNDWLNKGTKVGTVSVNYTGVCVNVTYSVDPAYYLGETHLWVGNEPLPEVTRGGHDPAYTDAPGQFPYGVDYGFDPADSGTWKTEWSWSKCIFSGEIYVAAHGVVWMQVECPEDEIALTVETDSSDSSSSFWGRLLEWFNSWW